MQWVVVGAGTAGCVVAGRLAESPEHQVTLIEAGPGAPSPATRGVDFFAALAEPGRTFPGDFTQGRGIGGSGAVNGMVATPGNLAQYRSWGWSDVAGALGRVRVPYGTVADDDLGPIDRALLAAVPDATKVALTLRNGERVTAADVYLADDRIELVADASVDRIELDGTRPVGVTLTDGTVIAADRVAVAAGAVASPLLLQRSGVDVPGLGEGLRNHPAAPVTLRLRPGVEVAPDGLVTASILRRGDIQILPLNHLGAGQAGLAMLLVAVMTPTGRGSVRADADADGNANVDHHLPNVHHEVTDHDRRRLSVGVAMVGELVDHPAFADLVDDITIGEPPAGVFHATSTCRMGTVVDADGAVRGFPGLHVVDASIFPDIPSANTYLPTLMLAERMATRLR